MNKNDLHIVIDVTPLKLPDLNLRVAAAQAAVRQTGISMAEAGAAMASLQAAFGEWEEVQRQLTHEQLRASLREVFLNDAMLQLGLDLKLRELERMAQQRAQLVLLLVFVLLTMLVGLL